MGELWVEYEVLLEKPRLQNASEVQITHYNCTACSAAAPLGTAVIDAVRSTFALASIATVGGASVITMPNGFPAQRISMIMAWNWTGGVVVNLPGVTTSGMTFTSTFGWYPTPGNGYYAQGGFGGTAPNNGIGVGNYIFDVTGNPTGQPLTITVAGCVGLPASSFCTLTLMAIPDDTQ